MRPLPTQLSATPPARHRFSSPVSPWTVRRHAEHDLLAHHLNRSREIHLLLRELRLRLAGRSAEQLVERLTRHREAGQVIEVLLVERERAVLAQIHQLAIDQIDVLRRAVWCEPHDLVLARVHLESGVVRERGIEQAEGIRPAKLLQQLELVAASEAIRSSRPFTDAIHREDGRLLERAGEERARRVRLVMLGVQQVALESAQRVTKLPVGEELFLDPERTRLQE